MIVSANRIEGVQRPEYKMSARFRVGWAETIGKRPTMEDAFVIQVSNEISSLSNSRDRTRGSRTAIYLEFMMVMQERQQPNIVERISLLCCPNYGKTQTTPSV